MRFLCVRAIAEKITMIGRAHNLQSIYRFEEAFCGFLASLFMKRGFFWYTFLGMVHKALRAYGMCLMNCRAAKAWDVQ